MSFRDKLIYCENSRRTFVLSVSQQRQFVERGDPAGVTGCAPVPERPGYGDREEVHDHGGAGASAPAHGGEAMRR